MKNQGLIDVRADWKEWINYIYNMTSFFIPPCEIPKIQMPQDHALADKATLIKLHCPLVRSKLNYGCFMYGAVRWWYIKELDTVYH